MPTNAASLAELCAPLAAQTLPRWAELPDLELYMDQVLSLIRRYLGAYPGFDGKGLTASMVNNYVKMGVMPAPVRKKYTRSHLAHLLMICVLKASLPIADIQLLLARQLAGQEEAAFYDGFCAQFEQSCRETAAACAPQEEAGALSALCRAALRAQAEQALAL
ncbi:MAG: DUF1836 domain-containing protein, partial [Oscillospiraceae bacterium]|nr:DUF1836 domain-containing protein [Oscillospiraceae bacterium]